MTPRRLVALLLLLAAAAPIRAVVWLDFNSPLAIQPYMTIDSSQYFKSNFYSLPGADVNRTTWTNVRSHSGAGSAIVGLDYDDRAPSLDANFWGLSDALFVSVNSDVSAHAGLTMYVYVESSAPQNGNPAYPLYGKLYVKTGAGWTWYNGALTTLYPDQWNKVQINFSAGFNASGTGPMVVPNVNELHEFGLQVVGGDYDRRETRLFVDTVELGLGDDLSAPAIPAPLLASNAGTGNRVNLSWTTVGDADLDHYNIYRSTAAGFSISAANRIKSVPAGSNTHIDESVVDGVAYRYRVTSVDKSGNESTPTSEASATPSGPAAFDLENKGMTYVAWSSGSYLSTDSMSSLDDLMSTGSDYVALVVTWYMTTANANAISADFGSRTPTDAAVVKAIQDIRARGMKVLLKPHVDVNDDSWRGAIQPTNPLSWFVSYGNFINHYADIAQANGVEMLCVGTELKTMTDNKFWNTLARSADWRSVINNVRTRYFGPLTYAANSNHPQDEYAQIEFWDALDFVGLNTWWKLTASNSPTVDQIKAAWSRNSEGHSPLQAAVNWRNFTGKNFFITELGARSANGTNMAPAEYSGSPGVDLQEQVDVYDANFAAWNHRSWVKGLFWWHWDPNPNGGGKYSDYYVPNDKPVLDLLTSKYGGENTGNNFRYTFESTLQGWTADLTGNFRNNLTAPSLSGTAHSGSGSAAYPIAFNDPVSGDISDFAFVEPSIRKDLDDYKGMKVFVRVPAGAISSETTNPLKVALVVQTGPNYDWFESNTARNLSGDQWREVSIDFSSAKTGAGLTGQPVTNLRDVRRIGLSVFGAGATNGSSTLFVDDIIARATWTVVGLSLNTTFFAMPTTMPLSSTVALTSLDFENSGNTNIRYHLTTSLSSPLGWAPSTTAPGAGQYVLNGMFNSTRPLPSNFVEVNHALTTSDQTAGASKFNGDQLGSGVVPGGVRNLWFEFHGPSVSSAADMATQTLTIGVLAEIQ